MKYEVNKRGLLCTDCKECHDAPIGGEFCLNECGNYITHTEPINRVGEVMCTGYHDAEVIMRYLAFQIKELKRDISLIRAEGGLE